MALSRPFLKGAGMGLGVALLLLQGCFGDRTLAGGSSGVDNPQVRVAFVDTDGKTAQVSGTLSLYLSDQNPAVDPAPLLKKLVSADSVVALSALDFKADSLRTYNLLLVANDGSGSLMRGLSYDPATRRFHLEIGGDLARIDLRLAPLVRYEGTLEREGSELVRVIAPGTPYQAVVVDSVFVFEGVPGFDSLLLHLLDSDGREMPLKNAPHEGPGGGRPRHHIDSTASPVIRPPPPEPTGTLTVNAGIDRSAILGSEFVLLGGVEGVAIDDPRLAVLWRQIDPPPGLARAEIAAPSALQSRVTFPWPGFYRFTLTAVFGNHRIEDTVLVGVQPPPPAPVFTDPNPLNMFSLTAFVEGPAFKVNWYAFVPDTLDLQISRDSGATWQTLYGDIVSYGPVERWWNATEPLSENCFLRLRRGSGKVVAYSTRFAVRAWHPFQFPGPF